MRSRSSTLRSKLISMLPLAYLHTTSAEIAASGYTRDCVHHAAALAALLHAAGQQPWIGRLKDVQNRGTSVFHAPLTPLRFAQNTWTTHYVACAGRDVYDPIAGEPVDVGRYAALVFGRAIPVVEFLSLVETAALLERGELTRALRTAHLLPVKG
jgi:hypothetical protein